MWQGLLLVSPSIAAPIHRQLLKLEGIPCFARLIRSSTPAIGGGIASAALKSRFHLKACKMNKRLVLAISLFSASWAAAALPEPGEIPKDGDCPSNYIAKGNQCQPTAQARFAFIKVDQCPDAYDVEGNYCIATATAKLAIRRAAMSCPSGFESIGNYCVSSK